MNNMVRWNLQELNTALSALRQEHSRLSNQRTQLNVQRNNINTNWQSPAGRQFQTRLQQDLASLDRILALLSARIQSLTRLSNFYNQGEQAIANAVLRLPR